uniref:Uncharacterized protein n=1 Tax=Lepeophtheirus salmonis TaxID=72036 RepID=A0A0K2U1B4_LEPSM
MDEKHIPRDNYAFTKTVQHFRRENIVSF